MISIKSHLVNDNAPLSVATLTEAILGVTMFVTYAGIGQIAAT